MLANAHVDIPQVPMYVAMSNLHKHDCVIINYWLVEMNDDEMRDWLTAVTQLSDDWLLIIILLLYEIEEEKRMNNIELS